MNDKELLIDLFQSFARWVHWVVGEMSLDVLRWQPDDEANNIAVTVWHFSRAFDLLKVRILENRPPEEELWRTRGWAEKTGYDPCGIGWSGFGSLGGYTRAEVEVVPILPAEELLMYFDQVCEALCDYLADMPADALYQDASGWPAEPLTAYECIRNILMDSLGHLGEIRAIEAMWDRKTEEDDRR